jgi:hypothetical protein
VPLAVFLLNCSGVRAPLIRDCADEIRATVEAAIKEEWKLQIAKEGRLVRKTFPRQLLPKLIKEQDRQLVTFFIFPNAALVKFFS